MKKLLSVLLIVCLVFAGFVSLINSGSSAAEFTDETGTVDYEKMYRLHQPDDIVGTINGRDVTWAEYYYAFCAYAKDAENYLQQIKDYYGMELSWTDVVDETSGETFESGAKDYAERFFRQYGTIEQYASDKNVSLDEAGREEIENMLTSNMASICGENATEAEFNEALEEMYMTRALYDRMMEDTILNDRVYTEVYGENGEMLTDGEVVSMLTDDGYMRAGHILLLTMDGTTGESISEDEMKEKRAKAEEFSTALNAIEDPQERYAEFLKLAEKNNEDSSVEYTFLSGTMVSEFETAVQSLKEYEVSEPVETAYGYHVIIRLPLDPDAQLAEYQMSGENMTGRAYCAQKLLNEEMNEIFGNMELEYKENFKIPEISKYVKA